MDKDKAKRILEDAARRFLDDDLRPQSTRAAFPNSIGERPMMFRLTHYMIGYGAEDDDLITVDCDYNRHGTVPKSFPSKREEGDETDGGPKPTRFFPDIVLHQRISDSSNVLVCEIKRENDRRDSSVDRDRLRKLTMQEGADAGFRYQLGAFIRVDTEACRISIEYFENGQSSREVKHLSARKDGRGDV
jgi:hypothetical protein